MAGRLDPPFPWFGGKRKAADMVWMLLGDPAQYVEPFAGSLAVLLARPRWGRDRVETVNDVDGMIVNMWRAIRNDPDGVAARLDCPVMEVELHARLARVNGHRTRDFVAWLEGDPEHSDSMLAADWLYATCNSIGYPFDPGPWHVVDGRLVNTGEGGGARRKIPDLGSGKGRGVNRELPALGDKGRGVAAYLRRLSDRLQWARITCGDWERTVKPSAIGGLGYDRTGILLDPPYKDAGTNYHTPGEADVAARVEEWCMGAPGGCRIVLCGYGEEHDRLLEHGWTKHEYRAGCAVFKNTESRRRERLWASPACDAPPTLFD